MISTLDIHDIDEAMFMASHYKRGKQHLYWVRECARRIKRAGIFTPTPKERDSE